MQGGETSKPRSGPERARWREAGAGPFLSYIPFSVLRGTLHLYVYIDHPFSLFKIHIQHFNQCSQVYSKLDRANLELKTLSEENERLEVESRKFKNQLEHR